MTVIVVSPATVPPATVRPVTVADPEVPRIARVHPPAIAVACPVPVDAVRV